FILGNSFSKPIPLNPFPFLYIPQFSRFTLLVYLTLSQKTYLVGPTAEESLPIRVQKRARRMCRRLSRHIPENFPAWLSQDLQ
ncbi:hypothetical protein ACSEUY_26025, partial [Pseudomonas aeruginosa]